LFTKSHNLAAKNDGAPSPRGLIQNFDSSTREVREGLVEERGRLGREHVRLEALTGALQVERHTLKEQVEVEQRRLEELREVRSREREIFLAECLEERKTLSRVLIPN
jgi:hypothetical protein